ncbi:MAG TPA: ATP-grasp domain-containing protein [candidate division WOR-3 bacterium]|uniref:ATP-grasp domain-containing protein n=1 Tax=candidate division WOR-3 bacterium TaxID=2052148 RepID=A0A7V0XGC6_UNCW3|nr:ATP-grasp domain-containing protein [candidate division WOR-3 bacterium]
MSKRRVLILGVGAAQADALRWCRDAGMEVHACGLAGTSQGLADHFVPLDVRDAAAVTEYARRREIALVHSVGSDIAMPTASAASEQLGLPHFVSADIARTCQRKHLLRQALGPDFRGNLSFRLVTSTADLAGWTVFPCVVKPADSQGQRGVFFAAGPAELDACYPASRGHSPSGQVIIEALARGPEVSANAYVVDGELRFLQVTDRIVFDEYPGGIIKAHRIPSARARDDTRAAVRGLVERVIARLGIKNGPVYFQIKLTEAGPALIEVTPRLDGCHLWRLIREYCGTDLLDHTFRHLLGQPLPSLEKKPGGRTLVLKFLCQPPGTPVARTSFEPGSYLHRELYYEPGETVRPINGHMERVGYLIRPDTPCA